LESAIICLSSFKEATIPLAQLSGTTRTHADNATHTHIGVCVQTIQAGMQQLESNEE